jgi:hypothetical protein
MSPSTKRVHLVSQVVLRRFCDDTNNLSACSLKYGRTFRTGPKGVCYSTDIDQADPVGSEQLWKTVEDRLPEALDAVEAGTVLKDPGLSNVLRECLALHWARSRTLISMYEQALPRILDRQEREMWADPDLVSVFRDQHHGLWPAGPAGLMEAARGVRERVEKNFKESGFVGSRFLANFYEAKSRADGVSLQIGVSRGTGFLIGDAPAQSLKTGHRGVGPLGGVPWGEANTVFMPLGPHHVMSLNRTDEYVDMNEDNVRIVNRIQIVAAHQHVVWHPDADFADLVDEVRDQG